jgi:hypothetical protein
MPFQSCKALLRLSVNVVMPAEPAGPQKRPVAGPRKGFMLQNTKLETITPIPYDILKVLYGACACRQCALHAVHVCSAGRAGPSCIVVMSQQSH